MTQFQSFWMQYSVLAETSLCQENFLLHIIENTCISTYAITHHQHILQSDIISIYAITRHQHILQSDIISI